MMNFFKKYKTLLCIAIFIAFISICLNVVGTAYQPSYSLGGGSGTIGKLPVSSPLTTLAPVLRTWTYSQSYALISGTRDANEALTSGSIVWPDGSTGTFTADTLSTDFPGAVDAYHVTYVPAIGSTKTITQPLLTRDAAGAVIAQPALIVS